MSAPAPRSRGYAPQRRGRGPRSGEPSLAALVLVVGVGPFATDTYLAALPQVQASLATSATLAQLSVTAFLVGLAVGQLTSGPVSDARGRRRLVVASSVAFLLTSVVCALAPSGPLLVAVRLVQGIAAGCGVAVGRAVVSDRYSGPEAAARYGTLAAITLLGPVVAPAIGGLVLQVGSWRWVFGFLAALGAAMTVGALLGIPETLPPGRRQATGPGELRHRVADLLGDPAFRGPVIVQGLATAGFFVYIGGSSFVLQTQLGVSEGLYAVVFATNAAAMSVVSIVFRLVVVRRGALPLRQVGLAMSTTAAVALAVVALAAGDDVALPPTWALLAVVVAGMGFAIPATTVLAQEAGRRSGGTASSLSGGLTFLVGALATPLTGLTGQQDVRGMAVMMAVLLVASVVASRVTRLSAGRSGPSRPAGRAG